VPADDRKLANPQADGMREAVEQLVKLGREAIVGLVDRLADPSRGTDTQVRHALHALTIHVAGLADNGPRRAVAQTLASTLAADRPKEAKNFVIRQLQVCGSGDAAEVLGKMLLDEDLCESAAQALVAIGGTAGLVRQALAQAKGRTVRLSIVQALGALRDAEAAPALREAARDGDSDVRPAALWGLARIGEATDIGLFITATNATGFERIQATDSCLLLAERLLAAGNKEPAQRIYRHLLDTRVESEAYVRQAAERGLAAIQ
jgi:HEAT repeat protein